jgi:hypothetical protein
MTLLPLTRSPQKSRDQAVHQANPGEQNLATPAPSPRTIPADTPMAHLPTYLVTPCTGAGDFSCSCGIPHAAGSRAGGLDLGQPMTEVVMER